MWAEKSRGYELHHPMSLGDAIAALFRGRPRPIRADQTVESALGLMKEPDVAGLQHPAALQTGGEACAEQEAGTQSRA